MVISTEEKSKVRRVYKEIPRDQGGGGVRCGTYFLPQTHKKNHLSTEWLNRTSTECWQETLNLQKRQEILHVMARTKGKKERKKIPKGWETI